MNIIQIITAAIFMAASLARAEGPVTIKGFYAGMPEAELHAVAKGHGGYLFNQSSGESEAEYDQRRFEYAFAPCLESTKMSTVTFCNKWGEADLTIGGARIVTVGWLETLGKEHRIYIEPKEEDQQIISSAVIGKYGRWDYHEIKRYISIYYWYGIKNHWLTMTSGGSIVSLHKDLVPDGDVDDF
jgi:hypothetical protein